MSRAPRLTGSGGGASVVAGVGLVFGDDGENQSSYGAGVGGERPPDLGSARDRPQLLEAPCDRACPEP